MVTTKLARHELSLDPFSEKLDAVFVKELRQGMRARRFIAPFLSIHALAILIITTQLLSMYFYGQNNDPAAHRLQSFSTGILDQSLLILPWLLVGIIMPLTGINALQSELSGGRNVELLLMAGLTRWQIMRGKWLVLCTLSGLMMISILPYMLTLYFTGGINLLSQMANFLGITTFNFLMNAVIVGSSGFRPLVGRVITIGLVFFSWFISSTIVLSSLSKPSHPIRVMEWVFYLLTYLLVTALYAIYGLQLGRSRLRPYEDPVDPPVTGMIIALIIFTPAVIGIFHVSGGPIGSLFALTGLTALGLIIDRGPGDEGITSFAQP